MFDKAFCFAIALALAISAQASQIFNNKGTRAGWDAINEEHNGNVQEVTNVFYEGPTALKMTQVYDPNYSGRYHSEVTKRNVYKRGDTGFYGFTFRLQQDWQISPVQSYNIAQFIADFADFNCGEDYMPSSMVWIVGNQLYSRVKYGSVCPKSAQKIRTFPNLATIQPGLWYKVEIQASWKSDNSGYYKMWLNGVKILEQFNIATQVDNDKPFEYRVGLYANGWHDDAGGMAGTQGTRQVWFDEIAAGSTFADADPDQW